MSTVNHTLEYSVLVQDKKIHLYSIYIVARRLILSHLVANLLPRFPHMY
jgi:hypothetical protein